ncbi:MAG: leucine--tRNA ligase [Betaproteobacteria bacterium TMED82]|nr:MAG: leucine--tRNA ligase [Betaproteobacteria bacterium TMED82]
MQTYKPNTLEKTIQAEWKRDQPYKIDSANFELKPKFYACSMLPYPSGKLHMGHVRNYTINDVIARWKRMKGFNVLMPMGWDAFGLPAENAALAKKKSPSEWTNENINFMKSQLKQLGLAIDWTKEISTCTPSYYKWNQWLFIKMLEKGIVFRKKGRVNWDPVDKTVLANEQVIDGKGWRSGATIEKKEVQMYYLRITKYTDPLLRGLDELNWPERVLTMQRNWIGKSSGLRFCFLHNFQTQGKLLGEGKLFVYTTRPDTIMGVTFVAISTEHEVAKFISKSDLNVRSFVNKVNQQKISDSESYNLTEKEGIKTTLVVKHPLTKKNVPLWIANYVLMEYGDGAVMGVPGHDERDFQFAKKYNIEIRQVITPVEIKEKAEFNENRWQDWYAQKEKMICVNSGKYSKLAAEVAKKKICQDIVKLKAGEVVERTRLRDWGISRQRYWGTPIPIVNCKYCGAVPVQYSDLPVILPENLFPTEPGNLLKQDDSFLNVKCPNCSKPAKRETDTMDTFVDSSWYFMRYCCPDQNKSMVDRRVNDWMPVDQYIGGIEHAVLHLLYARFWTKVMKDLNLVNFDEPFDKLLTQGMVLNQTFYRESKDKTKSFYSPEEVSLQKDKKGRIVNGILKSDGLPIQIGKSEKMSKSKNNGVDPQYLIDKYGADTARLFIIFAAPPEHTLEWSEEGVEGSYRFLKRLWLFSNEMISLFTPHAVRTSMKSKFEGKHPELRKEIHEILAQANFDMERSQFNTVVSASMKILNRLEKHIVKENRIEMLVEGVSILLRILYPISPHICCYFWKKLNFKEVLGDLTCCPWPKVDKSALIVENIKIVIQINGKVRDNVDVPANANNSEIEEIGRNTECFKRFSNGKEPKRTIVVPKRLINFVI